MKTKRNSGETGIFKISNEEYHGSDGISSTSLKVIQKSPKDFWHHIHSPIKQTDAMQFGTAVHEYLLERAEFSKSYAIEPEIEKVYKKDNPEKYEENKKIKEAFAQSSQGKIVLTANCFNRVKAVAESVESHKKWPKLKAKSICEISFYADIEGVIVKARPDILHPSLVADLKTTTADLTDSELQRAIVKFGYHFSAAMYLEIVKRITPEQPDNFVWIFVNSLAPHSTRWIQASPEMLEHGREEFYEALHKYKECVINNEWPGPDETIDILDLPRWYVA